MYPGSAYSKNENVTMGELDKWRFRYGFLSDVRVDACGLDPLISVEAVFYAGAKAVAAIIKPFPMAETWHELTSRAHKTKFSFSFREMARRLGIEFGAVEELELATPFAEGLGWYFFKVSGDLALKALWYLLVIDTAADFLVNWTSLAYQWQGCDLPAGPRAKGNVVTNWFEDLGAETDKVFEGWSPFEQQIFLMDNAQITTPSGYDPTVAFALSSRPNPFGFPDATFTCRLVDGITGDVWDDQIGRRDSLGGYTATFLKKGDIAGLGRHAYRVQISKTYGLLWNMTGLFRAYGVPGGSRNIYPDP